MCVGLQAQVPVQDCVARVRRSCLVGSWGHRDRRVRSQHGSRRQRYHNVTVNAQRRGFGLMWPGARGLCVRCAPLTRAACHALARQTLRLCQYKPRNTQHAHTTSSAADSACTVQPACVCLRVLCVLPPAANRPPLRRNRAVGAHTRCTAACKYVECTTTASQACGWHAASVAQALSWSPGDQRSARRLPSGDTPGHLQCQCTASGRGEHHPRSRNT